MSHRTLKLIALVAAVAVIFSAFNTYLILDNINAKDQLNTQKERINELETSLGQLNVQNAQIEELQGTINSQEERLNELQTALNEVSVPVRPIDAQQEQIIELQTAVNQAKGDLEEASSSLSTLTSQINAINQSTSTSLTEITTTVETIQNIISEISGLEELIDQLLKQTPDEIYEVTYRSVVVIRTPIGQGSGFMFNTSSMILTNYHVVGDETDIEIEFFDRTRTQATVIGTDAYSDIAVLTVTTAPAEALPLSLGEQSEVGQQIVAIGSPLGLTGSLSVGYISQVNRLIDLEPIVIPVLQLDLTTAPGSSGGPLLDLSGNVIGITNAGTEVGLNFAVPVNIMKRVIPSLLSEGEYKHPFVGVSLLGLTPETISSLNIQNVDPFQTGLLIMDVFENYPSAQAGLNPAIDGQQGYTAVDIILAVDGHPTFSLEDWSSYMEVQVSANQVVTLTLWRSGVTASVTLTTTERPPYEN